jgi:hypothetical protein
MEPERSTVSPQNTARGGEGRFWRRVEHLFDSPAPLADEFETIEAIIICFGNKVVMYFCMFLIKHTKIYSI